MGESQRCVDDHVKFWHETYAYTLFLQGAWLIHPVLIFAGKVVIDTIPGMRQEISWTLVNLLYLGVSAPQNAAASD